MAFHDDLLEQALQLVHKEPKKPKQASLRRGVSAAYYALFHFLISEAVLNWRRKDTRGALSRAFEHGVMKNAAKRVPKPSSKKEGYQVAVALKEVADAFVQLQESRHRADYDTESNWTRTEALTEVKTARQAFNTWSSIRQEPLAQEFLVSLLAKKR